MTRALEAEVVVPAQCELAEGPVWDAARGLLRWVDILPGRVHAFDPATSAHTWFDAGDPVGTLGLTRSGGLVLVGDVGLSNGLDWSDDRTAFYFADSSTGGVDVFGTDPDSGTLNHRRRFVTVGGPPDGLTLDAEGGLWVAVWGTGELRRYTPGGQLDTVVRLPVSQVTSAAFGGADLSTLYITTAREDFTPDHLREQPHAGDIFACAPGVAGRPPFLFAA